MDAWTWNERRTRVEHLTGLRDVACRCADFTRENYGCMCRSDQLVSYDGRHIDRALLFSTQERATVALADHIRQQIARLKASLARRERALERVAGNAPTLGGKRRPAS